MVNDPTARRARRAAWLAAIVTLLTTTAMPAHAQTPATVQPLSLEEALALAEATSETLAIARAGINRAAGDQLRARSQRLPQVLGTASYERALASEYSGLLDSSAAACDPLAVDPSARLEDRVAELERAVDCGASSSPFGDAAGNLPFGRKNTWRLGISVVQPLYTGGRVTAQNAIADASREAASIGHESARADLALEVVRAYYNAVLTDRLLAIAEATYQQADATYQQTRLVMDAGRVPEFEVLRAQVARDTQRPTVIRRRADRTVAHLHLKQLIEAAPTVDLQLTIDLGSDTLPPPAPFAAAFAEMSGKRDALDRTPVRQAGVTLRIGEANVRAAHSQRLPTINAVSTYGRVAYPSGVLPGWDGFRTNWTVGATLQIPIFTGGRLRGDEAMARAVLDESRARLKQAAELAQLDTQSALEELMAAQASWEASAGTIQQARRAHEIAEIRYREGLSTQLELSDSRLLLAQAEANRAVAARDLQIARVRVALLRDLPLGSGSTSFSATGASLINAGAQSTAAGTPSGVR